MKKFSFLSAEMGFALIFCMVFLLACNKGEKAAAQTLDKDTSYAFGMLMASQLGSQIGPNMRFDYDAFTEGFKAFLEAKETRLTTDQAMEKINAAFMKFEEQNNEQMWVEGQKNREEGEAYLAENGRRSGVTTTSSGLQYEVITEGNGERPRLADTVRVHYEGTLLDGTVFDSSYERGSPIEFPLNGVIPGWSEGVQLMSTGSVYRLFIPSDLAYGPGGTGPIPPSSTLIFKVELISIIK